MPTKRSPAKLSAIQKSDAICDRVATEAFEILDGLRTGDIKPPEASERSNALGKVNGAISNKIKLELLTRMDGTAKARGLALKGATVR